MKKTLKDIDFLLIKIKLYYKRNTPKSPEKYSFF